MNYQDLSVVIQGPVHPTHTPLSIASVRRFLPGAEIVLSSWKGQDFDGLDYDHLLQNDDPGAIVANRQGKPIFNNLNRQIVSTRNGLLEASRTYAVKLRSDCVLTKSLDTSILELGSRNPVVSIFESPVVCLNIYTRNPLRRPLLFHISDIFMFGLRRDLLTYWNVPLVDDHVFTRWMENRPNPLVRAFRTENFLFRCTPEQYLGERLAKNIFTFRDLQHMADGDSDLLFKSIQILANNFRILTPTEAGVSLPEKMASHESHFDLYQSSDIRDLAHFRKTIIPLPIRFKTLFFYHLALLMHTNGYYQVLRIKELVGRISVRRIWRKLSSRC